MESSLETKRHSVAHLVAAAVGELYEDVQFGVGPVVENGCYYDFVLPANFKEEDIAKIQKRFGELLNQDLIFEKKEVDLAEAIKIFEKAKQPLKVELLKDLEKFGTTKLDEESRQAVSDKAKITIYAIKNRKTGELIFEDLCRGPHIEDIKELKDLGVKIDKFSAAYWRGDQARGVNMQRLYTLVLPDKEKLDEFVKLRDEAKNRDHRVLGRDLELYFFHDTAPGIAYWLPKGLIVKNLLIDYWRHYHKAHGYLEIASPLINRKELWETSGHWDHYKDDMFLVQLKGGETWGVKPMNCPNAMNVFAFKNRSYKELPLRLSDMDTLHRNENPGTLHGLMRGRAFNQDDSHNFVTEAQINSEVEDILDIVRDFYGLFDLGNSLDLKISTMPDDHIGEEATWHKAEESLKKAVEKAGFKFEIKDKDGAFYGPKIDIYLTDALSRQWQCGTIQLDFQMPERFKLKYLDEKGVLQQPVVIHRVVYGSLERFIGILVEHFAGRLPYWIAPVQVKVLTVNDQVSDYVDEVAKILKSVVLHRPLKYNELRYEIDNRPESLGRKIREAETEKVPVIIIVGPKDETAKEVSVRVAGKEQKVALSELAEFLTKVN